MNHPARIFGHLVIILCLFHPPKGISSTLPDPRQFVQNGGYMVETNSGGLQYREQDLFIPASTLKILTTLVALESLGKGFRFETHFFLDSSSHLYIKGYGDPFLTSEAILTIGRELASRGITRLDSIYLDDSSFNLPGQVVAADGLNNPYDAPNGALGVNFNALPLLLATDGTISSGEPQTPLLPLMIESARGRKPGFYRVSINAFPGSPELPASLKYAGELFIHQFSAAGISIQHGFSRKTVPSSLMPIYIYYGMKSLEEIVRACLQYSSNYIANQLFLACGVKYFGLPATWEKSRRAFTLFTGKILGSAQDQVRIVEGSGLSRDNRISPAALVIILKHFMPYSALLNSDHKILVKTGTLSDVFCYAGYFPGQKGLIPFVILLNQRQNFRDNLIEILYASLQDDIRRLPKK